VNATVVAAALGALASVAVGIIANFLAEDYRRWRDGAALSAAIAGELASYQPAEPILRGMFSTWAHKVGCGEREDLTFRQFDKPTDLVFDSMVAKIGLLEPELIEDIVYVYGNLRGMRTAMMMVINEHSTMDDDEFMRRAHACIDALSRSTERGTPLVAALKTRARTSWRPWPVTRP
jgi:hypothetical protein